MSRLDLAIRYATSLIGLRKSDVLLSCFPRSGSTWVRFLCCNLVSLMEWSGQPVSFQLLDRTMPELGTSNLRDRWEHPTIPRIIKTHSSYLPLFRWNRSIGVIRDPRDVMVSYYHYERDRHGRYDGSFAEFIRSRRSGLERWFRHYTSWRGHWVLVVRYEDLTTDAYREFNRILDMLNVEYPENVMCEAIRRSSFQDIRAAETSLRAFGGGEARFAREGRTQERVSYFMERDLTYYYELVEKYEVYVYVDGAS